MAGSTQVLMYLILQSGLWISSVYCLENLYVLAMVPDSGEWPNGQLTRFSGQTALEHINAKENMLPGYFFNIIWVNSKCKGGLATFLFCTHIHKTPTKLMVIGESCSKASQPLAEISHYYNLTQMSADSISPVLSDTTLYPNFFRMWPPSTSNISPWIALLEFFGWSRIALLYSTLSDIPIVMQAMVKEMMLHNISLVTAEVFQDKPADHILNLKKRDAKIILMNAYQIHGSQAICMGWKLKLVSPKVVWILPGWYTNNWWHDANSGCTLEQMKEAVNGIIYSGVIHENDDLDQVGVSGYSSRQLDEIFNAKLEKLGTNGSDDMFAYYERFYVYDAVWATALALNATQADLAMSGEKKLTDFTYSDGAMGQLIRSNMASLRYVGQRGYIEFDEHGDPSSTMQLLQERDGQKRVGLYKVNRDGEFVLEWLDGGIQWPGGRVPSDATILMIQRDFLNKTIYLILCGVSIFGIMLAFIFLAFNIVFKKKREIKMSSPNINNIIILGCIVCYATVFLNAQREEEVRLYCMLWPISMTLGMSLTLGALLSKTWRVHVIFRNQTAMNVKINDKQLIGLVFALVAVNLVVLLIWEMTDPFTVTYIDKLTEALVLNGHDVTILHQVALCTSVYSSYFSGALYIIQGILLVFGAFLAWETRKVKVESLNDSQLIGMCIYNVFILSLLGVGLSMVLNTETLLVSTLTSIFLLVATFTTKSVIFIPKILKIVHGTADVMPTTMSTTNSTTKDITG